MELGPYENLTNLVLDPLLLREGRAFLKYSCCVCNIAEQEYLERELSDDDGILSRWLSRNIWEDKI